MEGPVSVDGKAVVECVDGLVDIVNNQNAEVAAIKEKYRNILKKIRKEINTISIFSSDPLGEHQEACTNISEILEGVGF